MEVFGPTLPIAKEIHATKYRQPGETFQEAMNRLASVLSDNDRHKHRLNEIFLDQRFLPAGRIQTSIGTPKKTTAYNCFVSGTIHDNFTGTGGIMQRATEAAETMRMGGGVGYDFSVLRPRGALITSLNSEASGPVSFMDIFDGVCRTVSSSGHRRGAQMGILRVDHPDIEEFVNAKQNTHRLTGFNISVAVTDKFMVAVAGDTDFDLTFNGRVCKTVKARDLWDRIMRATWDWAEPGVIFIDRINQDNNLWYCETIASTNPCSEQPLPPFGACLLGSFNLVKYLKFIYPYPQIPPIFDFDLLKQDIVDVVRAMDNVIDNTNYPLEEQKNEALAKRRMGLGITGFANASEILGFGYGTYRSNRFLDYVCCLLRDVAYSVSSDLAEEKGVFPLFDKDRYLESKFLQKLPVDVVNKIIKNGIRNSHLTSIAPTGTISIVADNVSSGIEPVFAHEYTRKVNMPGEPSRIEVVTDYAYRKFGLKGKTVNELSVDEHLGVLLTAQKYVDSAVSKTCNVGDNVTFSEFENIYMDAWKGGAKGLSTFRLNGKRTGILEEVKKEGEVCTIDQNGQRSCAG